LAAAEPVAEAFADVDGFDEGGVVVPLAVVDGEVDVPVEGATGTPQLTACAGATTPRKFRTAALPNLATSVPVPLGISTTS
jgi:hypothetical protein